MKYFYNFSPGVLPHVGDEVAALREGLPAHDALVRLLAWNEMFVKDCRTTFSKIISRN